MLAPQSWASLVSQEAAPYRDLRSIEAYEGLWRSLSGMLQGFKGFCLAIILNVFCFMLYTWSSHGLGHSLCDITLSIALYVSVYIYIYIHIHPYWTVLCYMILGALRA